MRAWVELTVPELLGTPASRIVDRLASAQARRHASTELAQMVAWRAMVVELQAALAMPEALSWTLLLEYDLLRLEKRADAVLLTDRAIFVLEWKHRATRHERGDMRQVEDYALDLHDFHAGCRGRPIIPVLVATDAPSRPYNDQLWHGVSAVICANSTDLPDRLRTIQDAIAAPAVPLDVTRWLAAPYRPVPSVLEAAAMLFDRHRSTEMTTARADAANLTRTTRAIQDIIAQARQDHERVVVFVTGIPGAGKTLCGLNIVFGGARDYGAVFLTGNAPLVEVLREDLRRRQAKRDSARHASTALQNVHRFLEHYVATQPDHPPPEHVIVFDEAQRAWNAAQATKDTQRRVSKLSTSEPAHTLEIMARAPDWSVIVALIGQGQEINTGEGGLAEWGRAIEASGSWKAAVAPRFVKEAGEHQILASPAASWLRPHEDLDLTVPLRAIRQPCGAAWVDAVLRGDKDAARVIAAEGGVPFWVTRDPGQWRDALRALARGHRRVGLVASSGAKRLPAEGPGIETTDVARFFLDRWPDVRSSEALEAFATEYDCQGLELDLVGVAWGGDWVRGANGWLPRAFRGSGWQQVRKPDSQVFVRNKYRVLLTRARYETVIWVPRGCARNDEWHDPTRPAHEMDAIARFLLECGAEEWSALADAEAELALL